MKLKIYKTVILSYFIWLLNMESYFNRGVLLRVFKNKVLRKIFGPRRDEETGEWRRLHNSELNDLYAKPDIIRKINLIVDFDGQGTWHEWEMKGELGGSLKGNQKENDQ